MSDERGIDDESIVRALETMPEINVPEDFASRVVARLPHRTLRVRSGGLGFARPSLGRMSVWIGLALVLVAMLWIAPRSQQSAAWLWMQVLLFVEFSGLLLWFTHQAAH